MEDIGNKQSELEIKIEHLRKDNIQFVENNNDMTEEITEKKNYVKNLELLIYILLDDMVYNREINSEINNNSKQLKNNNVVDHSKDIFDEEISRNIKPKIKDLSRFMTKDDQANFLDKLIHSTDDKVVKTLLDKALKKYNLGLEDISVSIKKNESKLEESNKNKNQLKILEIGSGTKTLLQSLSTDSPTTHLSSPTSLISTNDKPTNLQQDINEEKARCLTIKRKRADAIFKPHESSINLNQKENMFEEINSLTPCLISYANMSPQDLKEENQSILMILLIFLIIYLILVRM